MMHHVIDVQDVLVAMGLVLIPLAIAAGVIYFLASCDFSK